MKEIPDDFEHDIELEEAEKDHKLAFNPKWFQQLVDSGHVVNEDPNKLYLEDL